MLRKRLLVALDCLALQTTTTVRAEKLGKAVPDYLDLQTTMMRKVERQAVAPPAPLAIQHTGMPKGTASVPPSLAHLLRIIMIPKDTGLVKLNLAFGEAKKPNSKTNKQWGSQ